MSILLVVTLLAGLGAFVLLLVGWSRVMNSATGDTAGPGPIKLKDPLEFPDRPHYQAAGNEIRGFRKHRSTKGRGRDWNNVLLPKLRPLVQAFPDHEGNPITLPETSNHQQLAALLDELEHRAQLPPLYPESDLPG